MSDPTFAAFLDSVRIARGTASDVVRACLERRPTMDGRRLAIYDLDHGRVVDVDFSGDEEAVLGRIAERFPEGGPPERDCQPSSEVEPEPMPRRRGRPKLGVVGKEVTLLPRHWQWLETQRGGASATLRRLVETAKKADRPRGELRRVIHCAYGFMSDIAGDRPHFEEASRSLFAHDFDRFEQLIESWPKDVRDELHRYVLAAIEAKRTSVE